MKTNLKKMILTLTVLLAMLGVTLQAGVVENKDKPAKGEYIFPLQKVWQVDKAGETFFANIVSIPVSDSGYLYCRDIKNKQYYAFDKDGKYIATFGNRGEGPGEIKQSGMASISTVGTDVIIQDTDKFLYFHPDGTFRKSVPNSGNTRPASLFLNPDEFISAPANITAAPEGKANMRYVNLKTGTEKIISDFSLFKGGVMEEPSGRGRAIVVIPTITPMLIVGNIDKRLYYGMNDKYEILVTNLEGKDLGLFRLEREKRLLPLKKREDFMVKIAKGMAPPEMAKRMAKMLPEKETYFSNIESHGDLLYVYRSHFIAKNFQQIDIFSTEGKYLYKGIVKVKEGLTIAAGPTINGNHIYLALEDEEGEISIYKYNTTLPQ